MIINRDFESIISINNKSPFWRVIRAASLLKPLSVFVVSLLLISCVNNGKYQSLEGQFHAPSDKNPSSKQQYTVAQKDTLYSIAWRFELDYRALAQANEISSPYVIYPGQTLNLVEDFSNVSSATKHNITLPKIPSKPIEQKTEQRQKNTTISTGANKVGSSEISWLWPFVGNIVRAFGSGLPASKGIDIQGQLEESVHTAAAGTIVYAGAGPLGYGQLIIVQHDQTWLSAYSNVTNISVKEKQNVKAAQKIAEIGKDSNGKSILHFEIRRQGKPTDPIRYLPKR